MKHIYYFHDWNSGIEKNENIMEWAKFGEMFKFNDFIFDEVNYKIPMIEISRLVEKILDPKITEVILTGIGLGGWFARMVQVAAKDSPIPISAVAFNPMIKPGRKLIEKTGMQKNEITKKAWPWNKLDCEELIEVEDIYDYHDPEIPYDKFVVFVDVGNDTTTWAISQTYHQNHAFFSFKGGSHKFEHMKSALGFLGELYYDPDTSLVA